VAFELPNLGLWDKIYSVLGKLIGQEDRTSTASIDQALSKILEKNETLLKQDSQAYESICKIAEEAGLIRTVPLAKNDSEISIHEKAKNIHKVADFLRQYIQEKKTYEDKIIILDKTPLPINKATPLSNIITSQIETSKETHDTFQELIGKIEDWSPEEQSPIGNQSS
jgi:hypothetical protein